MSPKPLETLSSRRRRRKRFSGLRDETEPVGTYSASDGRKFDKRWDGSIYPKLTTIPVSQSVRKVCSILRSTGGFDNYDELILDLVKRLIPSEESNVSLHLNEETIKFLREYVARAEIDRGYRKSARTKAAKKGRYRRR